MCVEHLYMSDSENRDNLAQNTSKHRPNAPKGSTILTNFGFYWVWPKPGRNETKVECPVPPTKIRDEGLPRTEWDETSPIYTFQTGWDRTWRYEAQDGTEFLAWQQWCIYCYKHKWWSLKLLSCRTFWLTLGSVMYIYVHSPVTPFY